MKDRIIQFLSRENKTSAQFAEEIGVQPSGVSHILSGRNNPSLDFVLKMLTRYNYVSPEWLLFGKEPAYRTNVNPTLFDEEVLPYGNMGKDTITGKAAKGGDIPVENDQEVPAVNPVIAPGIDRKSTGALTRIILFFGDRKFEEYSPG